MSKLHPTETSSSDQINLFLIDLIFYNSLQKIETIV